MTLKFLKENPRSANLGRNHGTHQHTRRVDNFRHGRGRTRREMPKVIPDCRQNILFFANLQKLWLEGRNKLELS